MPMCRALRRLRQEDCEFETTQDYLHSKTVSHTHKNLHK